MELARELNRLEQQAAVVGRLLRNADEATIQQAVAGWAPLKPKSYQPRRWDAFWLEWLVECSERLPPAEAERVPVVPSRVDQGENWTCPGPLLRSHQHDDLMGCGI